MENMAGGKKFLGLRADIDAMISPEWVIKVVTQRCVKSSLVASVLGGVGFNFFNQMKNAGALFCQIRIVQRSYLFTVTVTS